VIAVDERLKHVPSMVEDLENLHYNQLFVVYENGEREAILDPSDMMIPSGPVVTMDSSGLVYIDGASHTEHSEWSMVTRNENVLFLQADNAHDAEIDLMWEIMAISILERPGMYKMMGVYGANHGVKEYAHFSKTEMPINDAVVRLK